MKVAGLQWLWLYLLLLLVLGASQIQAQTSLLPPISTSTSASQGWTEDVGSDDVTDAKPTSEATAFTYTEEPATATATTPVSTQAGDLTTASASERPSVTPTSLSTSTIQTPGHTFSSQPDRTPSALASTEPRQVSLTTAFALSTVPQRSQGIAGPAHQEIPSQLNVGDEDFKGSGHRSKTLDPLLAGILSVIIVTTAVIFVVLFLKFRHQNSNPEFHRLQDLPMDDLMEDTPLSRYTY